MCLPVCVLSNAYRDFFVLHGTVSFFIKLYLIHFAWNSVSPFNSPGIRRVCHHVFYCTFC